MPDAVLKRLRRSYAEWLASAAGGRMTSAAAGAANLCRRRRKPDEPDWPARHVASYRLGFALHQWFVDESEAIKGRAVSRMLVGHAVGRRATLLASGAAQAAVPKINKCCAEEGA